MSLNLPANQVFVEFAIVFGWTSAALLVIGAVVYLYQFANRQAWGNFDTAVVVFYLSCAIQTVAMSQSSVWYTQSNVGQEYDAVSLVLFLCLFVMPVCYLYIMQLRTKVIMEMKWFYRYLVWLWYIDLVTLFVFVFLWLLSFITGITTLGVIGGLFALVSSVCQIILDLTYAYNFAVEVKRLQQNIDTPNAPYYRIIIKYGTQATICSLLMLFCGPVVQTNLAGGDVFLAASLGTSLFYCLQPPIFHAMKLALRNAQIDSSTVTGVKESFVDYSKMQKAQKTSNETDSTQGSKKSKAMEEV